MNIENLGTHGNAKDSFLSIDRYAVVHVKMFKSIYNML
jgi:hypothetical protein